jgi:hypothetical protein
MKSGSGGGQLCVHKRNWLTGLSQRGRSLLQVYSDVFAVKCVKERNVGSGTQAVLTVHTLYSKGN